MAENGVITIRFVESGDEKPTPGPQKIKEKKVEESNDDLRTAVVTTLIQKAGDTLKQLGASQIKFQINRYFDMTDDYMAQQNMNIALSALGRAYGAGKSIVGGYMAGGVAGAIVTGLAEAAKLGLEIYQNYSTQNYNLRKMNAQLQFNRQRAGYSLTAGANGENR